MDWFKLIRRNIFWLLLLLIISSCSGMEPYAPVNHREEGPESGLFSGPDGDFVIYRKTEEKSVDSDSESDSAKVKKETPATLKQD